MEISYDYRSTGGWQIYLDNGYFTSILDEQIAYMLKMELNDYRELFDDCIGYWEHVGDCQFFIFLDVYEVRRMVELLESLLVMKELIGEQ